MPTQQKIEQVNKLKEILKDKPNIFILNFSKVTVKDITILRQKIKEKGSNYIVAKNTLLKRAFEESGIQSLNEYLEGPTAIVVSPSKPEEVAKILIDYSSQNTEFYFKGGYIDQKPEKAESLKALATLPPKEELIGRVLFMLNNPIQRLVNVLSSPLSGLCRVLQAIASNK